MWWMRWILTNSDIWEALAPSSWRSDRKSLVDWKLWMYDRNMQGIQGKPNIFSPCFLGPALDSDTLLMIWWTQGWLMSSNLKSVYSHLCLVYGIYGVLCLVHSVLVSLAAHDLPMQQFFYQNQRTYEVNKNNIYTIFPLPASDESTNLSKPSKWDCPNSNFAGLWRFLWSSWQSRYAHRL